jgi:hypothetical protein
VSVPTFYDIQIERTRPVTQADVDMWLRFLVIHGPFFKALMELVTPVNAELETYRTELKANRPPHVG